MSVRVNLLPEATRQRSRAAQQRAIAGALGVTLLAGLGGIYWWASSEVSKAEVELAEAERVTSSLRVEVDELNAFAELESRRDVAVDAVTIALAEEVSVAGLLQDFAAVVPPDTEFTTLNIQLAASEEDASTGTFNLTGRTLTSHTGVERTMLQLEKVSSFLDLYLNSSALDDIDAEQVDGDVATFSLDGNVGPRAATGRYADGLPEGLR